LLSDFGVKVWFGPAILKVGDSLSRSIDKGLVNSKFAAVVLSKAFISKPWPEYELRGLTSRAIGAESVILPIWHNITRDDLLKFSPPLADTIALISSNMSLNEIALKIVEKVRPDIFNNLLRLIMWRKLVSEAKTEIVPIKEIKPGPIRHKTLPEGVLIRIKLIHFTLSTVLSVSLESTINNFRRDANPMGEIAIWERITAAYLDLTSGKNFSIENRGEILSALLGFSTGMLDEEKAHKFRFLNYKEVVTIRDAYLGVVPRIVEPADESRGSGAA
jgi:hypothetical protein